MNFFNKISKEEIEKFKPLLDDSCRDFVDFVLNVLPQAHVTVAFLYSGCIPAFI